MEAFSPLFGEPGGLVRVRPGVDGILHLDHGYLLEDVKVSRRPPS